MLGLALLGEDFCREYLELVGVEEDLVRHLEHFGIDADRAIVGPWRSETDVVDGEGIVFRLQAAIGVLVRFAQQALSETYDFGRTSRWEDMASSSRDEELKFRREEQNVGELYLIEFRVKTARGGMKLGTPLLLSQRSQERLPAP